MVLFLDQQSVSATLSVAGQEPVLLLAGETQITGSVVGTGSRPVRVHRRVSEFISEFLFFLS